MIKNPKQTLAAVVVLAAIIIAVYALQTKEKPLPVEVAPTEVVGAVDNSVETGTSPVTDLKDAPVATQ